MSTVEELKKENIQLKMMIKNLKQNIEQLQDLFGYEINEYFFDCNSLLNTTEHFFFESVKDCYDALLSYNGCSDPMQEADDYQRCYQDIFGEEYKS